MTIIVDYGIHVVGHNSGESGWDHVHRVAS